MFYFDSKRVLKLTIVTSFSYKSILVFKYYENFTITACGGLSLVGLQVPPSCAVTATSSGGWGRKIMKVSWVKIRTGREHSPVTITGKTDST